MDFSLYYKEGKCAKEKKLFFHCEERSLEGFLIYSIELDYGQNDSVEAGLKSKMQAPIYHYIKDFFHRHIHHHPSHDSLLRAYFSISTLSLKNAINKKEIMEFYASLYLQKFEAFEEDATLIYQNAKLKINSRYRINKGIKQLEFLLTEGRSISGEAEFCTFLMEMGASVISKDIRKDIRELINRINEMQQRISFSYNLCTSSYGVKLGYWGIWFGVIGILVGVFSVVITMRSSPDYSMILEHSDSVGIKQQMYRDSVMDKNQQQLINRLDSIRQLIRKEGHN